jgi:hypothetical protein
VIFLCPACHRGLHHGRVKLRPNHSQWRTRRPPVELSAGSLSLAIG